MRFRRQPAYALDRSLPALHFVIDALESVARIFSGECAIERLGHGGADLFHSPIQRDACQPGDLALIGSSDEINISRDYRAQITQRSRIDRVRAVCRIVMGYYSCSAVWPNRGNANRGIAQIRIGSWRVGFPMPSPASKKIGAGRNRGEIGIRDAEDQSIRKGAGNVWIQMKGIFGAREVI